MVVVLSLYKNKYKKGGRVFLFPVVIYTNCYEKGFKVFPFCVIKLHVFRLVFDLKSPGSRAGAFLFNTT